MYIYAYTPIYVYCVYVCMYFLKDAGITVLDIRRVY